MTVKRVIRVSWKGSIEFKSGDMLSQSITFTLSFFSKAVVVILLEYCPAAQSPKGGDHALLQYVTVHYGIHGSLNELYLPSAGSTHAASDHDTPITMLDYKNMRGVLTSVRYCMCADVLCWIYTK